MEPSIEEALQRISKFIPRQPGDPEKLSKVSAYTFSINKLYISFFWNSSNV